MIRRFPAFLAATVSLIIGVACNAVDNKAKDSQRRIKKSAVIVYGDDLPPEDEGDEDDNRRRRRELSSQEEWADDLR